MYELERVNWALKSDNLPDAQKFFRKYIEDAIPEWNIQSPVLSLEIKRYFGKKLADKLTILDQQPSPNALYSFFNSAHEATKNWKFCVEQNNLFQKIKLLGEIKNCDSYEKKAENSMENLKKAGVGYIEKLNDEFQKDQSFFF